MRTARCSSAAPSRTGTRRPITLPGAGERSKVTQPGSGVALLCSDSPLARVGSQARPSSPRARRPLCLAAAAFPPLAAGWNKRGGAVLFPGFCASSPLPGGPSETCRNLTFFARCATTSATFAHLGLAVRRGAIVHGDALAFGPQGAGRPHFLRAIRESAPQRLGGPASPPASTGSERCRALESRAPPGGGAGRGEAGGPRPRPGERPSALLRARRHDALALDSGLVIGDPVGAAGGLREQVRLARRAPSPPRRRRRTRFY